MSKSLQTTLPIDDLIFDPRMQMRSGQGEKGVVSSDHADDLATAVKKQELPDKVRARVWRVEGVGDVVTDGHHLCEGFRRAGKKMVPVYLFNGTIEDAILDAAGANIHKGAALKRTHEDKRNAVKAVLKTRPSMSNRDVATHTGTSDFLVRDVRAEMENSNEITKTEDRVGRDGKVHRSKHSGSAVKTTRSEGPSEKKKAKKKKVKTVDDLFDKKGWDSRWGWMVRAADSLAALSEKGPHYDSYNKACDSLKDILTDWMKKIREEAKAAREAEKSK